MKIERILRNRQVIITIGTGGVGKTSISSAMAYCGGILGIRSLVLTIDPARRLASALKISVGDEEKRVEHNGVVFYASQLDIKKSMDRLIEKYAPTEDIKNSILSSRIYNIISDLISGSQEYVSAERLYEVLKRGEYDTIILDTPPAYEAIDFLKAPERVTEFFRDRFLSYFVGPLARVSRVSFDLITRRMPRVFNPLMKIAGVEFLKELLALMASASEMFDDMNVRSKEVLEMLSSHRTSFVYVTIPVKRTVEEFKNLKKVFTGLGLKLDSIILNRFQPEIVKKKDLERLKSEDEQKEIKILAEYYFRRRALHQQIKEMFIKSTHADVITVPDIPEGISGLDGLRKIALKMLKN